MFGMQSSMTGVFRGYPALKAMYGQTEALTVHIDFDLSYTNSIFSGSEVKPKAISVLVLLRL